MANEIKVEANTTTEDVNKEDTKVETEGNTEVDTKETVEEGETPESKKARMTGSLKRMARDLQDLGEDPSSILGFKAEKTTVKPSKKSNDLDYGEKSFLIANGIKLDEISFAQDLIKKTGLSLEDFVTDEYAQAKLKVLRDSKATSQATPSGSKRVAGQTKDSVDYHLEKYESGTMQLNEMPFEMRSKVLTAKMEKDKKASQFSFTPSVR